MFTRRGTCLSCSALAKSSEAFHCDTAGLVNQFNPQLLKLSDSCGEASCLPPHVQVLLNWDLNRMCRSWPRVDSPAPGTELKPPGCGPRSNAPVHTHAEEQTSIPDGDESNVGTGEPPYRRGVGDSVTAPPPPSLRDNCLHSSVGRRWLRCRAAAKVRAGMKGGTRSSNPSSSPSPALP